MRACRGPARGPPARALLGWAAVAAGLLGGLLGGGPSPAAARVSVGVREGEREGERAGVALQPGEADVDSESDVKALMQELGKPKNAELEQKEAPAFFPGFTEDQDQG